MISNRVKSTKAFQVAGDRLPLSVWEDIADLAAKHRVDLNTISSLATDCFRIGEPRTGLTIQANVNGAMFQEGK